jgi:hypothetical protein
MQFRMHRRRACFRASRPGRVLVGRAAVSLVSVMTFATWPRLWSEVHHRASPDGHGTRGRGTRPARRVSTVRHLIRLVVTGTPAVVGTGIGLAVGACPLGGLPLDRLPPLPHLVQNVTLRPAHHLEPQPVVASLFLRQFPRAVPLDALPQVAVNDHEARARVALAVASSTMLPDQRLGVLAARRVEHHPVVQLQLDHGRRSQAARSVCASAARGSGIMGGLRRVVRWRPGVIDRAGVGSCALRVSPPVGRGAGRVRPCRA